MTARPATLPRLTPASTDGGARAETVLAGEIKLLLAVGRRQAAAERFSEVVALQQGRATRIAYHYLREPAEVDEVVQDAFLKAFLHLPTFRENLYFELWFTRILVNGCLDRLKSRKRKARWLVSTDGRDGLPAHDPPSRSPSPEAALLSKERRSLLDTAIARLPNRQRTAVILSHLEGRPAKEVSIIMGLRESTVRVHLFRAVRKLRDLLDRTDWLSRDTVATSPQGH